VLGSRAERLARGNGCHKSGRDGAGGHCA
jgi:hypothetical protein